jgi:hypothetical protein
MRALDGWYAPRFSAFSQREAVPVSELSSPPAASNAKPLGADTIIGKVLMTSENGIGLRNKMTVNPGRVGAWALIACAFHGIFFLAIFWLNLYTGLSPTVPFVAIEIVFALLLLMGLLAIQLELPPIKRASQIGLTLMIIRPIILVAFFLPLLAPGHYRIQSLLSIPRLPILYLEPVIYFVPYLGYLLTGWLTLKTKVFPAWVGWILILAGLCNMSLTYVGMYLTIDSLHKTMLTKATLTEALAFAGYGWHILKQ